MSYNKKQSNQLISESHFGHIMQMNTPLFRERRISLLSKVKPAMHPILWVDEGADLDDENADMLKWMLVVPSIVLEVGALTLDGWSLWLRKTICWHHIKSSA